MCVVFLTFQYLSLLTIYYTQKECSAHAIKITPTFTIVTLLKRDARSDHRSRTYETIMCARVVLLTTAVIFLLSRSPANGRSGDEWKSRIIYQVYYYNKDIISIDVRVRFSICRFWPIASPKPAVMARHVRTSGTTVAAASRELSTNWTTSKASV